MARIPGTRVALALALAVIVVAVGWQLTHETVRAAGSNGVEPRGFVISTDGSQTVCQHREVLYAGTASLRMTIGASGRPGPPIDVQWIQDERVLARGHLDGGWREGVVRIPLDEPPSTTTPEVSVCFSPEETRGQISWAGEGTSYDYGLTVDGTPNGVRLSIVSELSGSRSLFSMFGRAAERYPAGNAAWLGPWTWWVIIFLAGAALAAAGVALVRPQDATNGLVPPAGWLCALAALLACTAWALLIPPFHVPDENAHTAYVQSIVESGELPRESESPPGFSEQERSLLEGLNFYRVIGRPLARPLWTSEEEAGLRDREDAPTSREVAHAWTASANPPLFYLLQAPVYWMTPSTELLDKLLPMRVLCALLGALTVLAIFLFLRELVPGTPWLWSAGALVVALHPGFGFISAGVNPDALLFTLAATAFWLIARILRHGATVKRAAALGGVLAAGVLTKPLFLGLLPAAGIALLIAVLRRRGQPSARRVLVVVGTTLALAAVPVLIYDVVGRIGFDHPYFAEERTVGGTVGASAGSLSEEISYVSQLWLPRWPGSHDHFPDAFPLRDIWVDGFVGQYGWLDYRFPARVEIWAECFALLLLAGALLSLYLNRRRMRGRWLELGVYAAAAAGIAAVIGSQDYGARDDGVRFTQARYVFPLLALYAGLIAVALRAPPRRIGWYCGVALVTIAAVHELSAMLLTVGRYYV